MFPWKTEGLLESRFAIIAPQTCPGFTNQRALYTSCRSRVSLKVTPNSTRDSNKTPNLLLRDANLDRGICEMRKMLKVVAISQLLEIRSLKARTDCRGLGCTCRQDCVWGDLMRAADTFYLEIHWLNGGPGPELGRRGTLSCHLKIN